MWKWNENLNIEMALNKSLVESFKKYSKVGGILFIILGILGIIFPTLMSLTTLAFVAYLMIIGGFFSGWLTWKSNKEDWAGWLKSFILLLTGLLMIFYPMIGVASLGLLLSVYFFMDAFAGFWLAFSLRPQKIWIFWLINAITSLILAIIFIVGWPFSSLYLVGLFVGISLLFDGIVLLTGGFYVDKKEDDNAKKA